MTEYFDFEDDEDENVFNFENHDGDVPAHRHPNGGGWVANTARVADTVYVEPYARVYGDAVISGNVVISGRSYVYGDAMITEDVEVYGIRRSDGYVFVYVPDADGVMKVQAVCTDFTMEEAKKHWKKTIGGTPLGDETMAILNCIEILSKVKPKGCV